MIFFMADIHIGVKLPFQDFMKSLEYALELIKQHEEPCDGIMILGDLFDHHLNIEESCQASQFITRLVLNGCGRGDMKHVPVHFIEGTFSHDRKQMRIFQPLLNRLPVSVFYTDTWCKAKWSNGMKVLYLPQEYGNVDYTEAFNEQYDLIIGHGPISSKQKEVVTSHGTEIMHSVETLKEYCKLCVFGHYHEYTDFGDNVYYAGSMLRFRYGEDVPKVFFMCDKNFKVTTVKNPFAKEFKTIEIHNPEELRDELSKNIETPHRFIIHSDNSDLQTYHEIMNINKQNTNLSYKMMTEEPVEESDKIEVTETSPAILEPISSLVQYINERYQVNLEKEVREYEDRIKKETK